MLFRSALLLLTAAACASGPTRGLYDDPEAAAQAEAPWSTKLNEADVERLARAAQEKIEACLASVTKTPEIRVLPMEDRTGKNADVVSLAERLQGGLVRGGKVRLGESKARFVLASVLSLDPESSEYRLALALSESGATKSRCDETVAVLKVVPAAVR